MKTRHVSRLSALTIALITSQLALAQQVDPDKAQTLGVITVTAGRGTELEDMPLSTTVLDRQQVQTAPETTADQIVNKIPGIFINNVPSTALHPTGSTFSIRGFGTSTVGAG